MLVQITYIISIPLFMLFFQIFLLLDKNISLYIIYIDLCIVYIFFQILPFLSLRGIWEQERDSVHAHKLEGPREGILKQTQHWVWNLAQSPYPWDHELTQNQKLDTQQTPLPLESAFLFNDELWVFSQLELIELANSILLAIVSKLAY